MIEKKPVSWLKPNPNNPRVIRDDKFRKLVKSLRDFPEMLDARPIVANSDGMVLGGNMRLRAAQEAGMNHVPVFIAETWSEKQEREFIIKDNIGYGEWDWDILANEWDTTELVDWGVDVPIGWDEAGAEDGENPYTAKIGTPIYEPSAEMPSLTMLVDTSKYEEVLKAVEKAKVPSEIKSFLRLAAGRFVVFDYQKIADFYAGSDEETQAIFETLALVVIDFESAIEKGFVKMVREITGIYEEHYA